MSSSVTIESWRIKMKLTNLLPNISMAGKKIVTSEISKSALQLTGYFDHFYSERVQIIGYVEYTYLEHLPRRRSFRYMKSFSLIMYRVSFIQR